MPTPFIKKLAKEHNLSLPKVEKVWDKAKAIVEKEYGKKFDKFWPYVVGLTKKMIENSEKAKASIASATIDEVYSEKAKLIKFLTCLFPTSIFVDPEENEFNIIYIETPTGQLSWHIKKEDCSIFENLKEIQNCPWDGHDTNEKYERLAKLCAVLEAKKRK